LTTLLFCVALWLGYLAVEAVRLRRWQEAIPVRIAVTGTRGKSSVVRMLAAVLREDGWRVLAKSTGTEAALILPDGSERPIRRRGRPSILEQVGVVGLGARLGVDAIVVEVMSLHAENHTVETQRILRPHMVLATNFRVDHVEAHGGTKAGVARVLALDVPAGARVLVPEDECEEAFARRVEQKGAALDRIAAGVEGGRGRHGGLRSDSQLVRAAAEALGVDGESLERGLRDVLLDSGAFRLWRYPRPKPACDWLVVNAFAANDPQSTFEALDALGLAAGPGEAESDERPVGLLSLRRDRGDRSLLWGKALRAGALSRFSRLYIHGFHARALRRMLRDFDGPRVDVLPSLGPGRVMQRIMGGEGGSGVVFGFGNMGGLGEKMVRHWNGVGVPAPLETEGVSVDRGSCRPDRADGGGGGFRGI
jgi:poly-gamma-glutamate synthase PgsB/CapB